MNEIFEAMNKPREVKKNTVTIFYGQTACGKSSLFRNAPDVLFLDLENRLNHIDGTFKSIKKPSIRMDGKSNIDEIQKVIETIAYDYKHINTLKEIIEGNNQDRLKKAKDVLKDKFDSYFKIAKGEISYPKLLIVDAVDDLKSAVDRRVCEDLKIEDLSELDRNAGYGVARTRFLDLIRMIINIGIPVVLLAGVIDAKDSWNTKGKNIPNAGGGTAYDYLSRKISGVFPINIKSDDTRVILTNNSNGNWFIKNSFDKIETGFKLPIEIPLDFEEINKYFQWYSDEEIKIWKEKNNLKKL